MLAFLFAAQLAAVDSLYATPAVRTLVEAASRINRQVPPTLAGYRASAESEIAIVARRSEGNEGAVSIEQTRNEVTWDRTGAFEQHVVGYRAQSIGFQFSALSFLRQAWTVPVLYGNRLTLLFGRDTSRLGRARRRQEQRLVAVHPLAEDRERVYRFSGGDTIVTLRVNERDIPILRVMAEPRDDAPEGTVAFRGELDLDASRHVLVRMRGYFVRKAPPPSFFAKALSFGGFEAVAFLELENGEIEGKYWLPTYQRFEAQAALTSATESRSIFRIITRFSAHRVMERPADAIAVASVDTLSSQPFALTFAPRDSLADTEGWRRDLGATTGAVHSDDFNDIGPDIWRSTGAPRFGWRVQRVADAVHINRIEGLYTGYGAEWRLRDAVPGLTLRGNAGWAWSEETVRGRAGADWKRGALTYIARAGRTLDITNDFRPTFDSGSVIGAAFGSDSYDYVDRRVAAVGVWRRFGKGRAAVLRLETGPASDRMVERTLSQGIIRRDSAFRDNRGVREGTYWRHWASLEWNPDVSAEFVRTGVGALVSAEVAQGTLRYTRLEGRLMGRRNAGPLTLAARGDVGTLLGRTPPPQQLFELGNNQNLAGYDYKEFAGTDAAVVRGLVMYRLGSLRAPIRVGRWFLPAPSPALAAGVQSGWTQVRGDGGRLAMRELVRDTMPAYLSSQPPTMLRSRATNGVRTSVTLGMRFFGGAVGVGMARAVDRKAEWKLVFDFAQIL